MTYQNSKRIVLMVSTDPSDLYFANQIARRFRICGIVLEHQRHPPDRRPRLVKVLELLRRPLDLARRALQFLERTWHRQLSRRFLNEQAADFGEDGRRLHPAITVPVLRVAGKGRLNDPESVRWLRDRHPDLIAVCGTSILAEPILRIPSLGVLNLHGGLSQHYRGLFTTDWAILNNEPEKVGATVHYVSEGVDEGKVIFQGRPMLAADDHPNKAYESVVKLGVEMMSAAIIAIDGDRLHPPLQPAKGRLYRERDFTNRIKRRLWRRWQGIMTAYDMNREERDARVVTGLINPFDDVPVEPDGADTGDTGVEDRESV